MKTHVLTRVRKHFNSEYVPAYINRRNMRAWVRSVRMLGDRWLLAQPTRKEECRA
jgi:hypothetical protein